MNSSLSESKRRCENTFSNSGPYWHAYTSGKETPIIFPKDEDYKFAMNVIAQAAAAWPEVHIVAFEIMSNHFHFALNAQEPLIEEFWSFIRKRLSRIFPEIRKIGIYYKRITDLPAMRNTIAYINRNGYVANRYYTPFSYPWGTGRFYFMDEPDGCQKLGNLSIDVKRNLFRCRTPELPADWDIKNGYVCPNSYCAIKFGMAIFTDAQSYFNTLSKDVESWRNVAVDIEDEEFLTDQELMTQVLFIIKEQYGVGSVKSLVNAQKLDLARKLRRDYHSSNEQIRRALGLSQFDIDQLYPKKSKQ